MHRYNVRVKSEWGEHDSTQAANTQADRAMPDPAPPTGQPTASTSMTEPSTWAGVIALAQADLARLTVGPSSAVSDAPVLAARTLAIVMAACAAHSGSLVSVVGQRAVAGYSATLLAANGMTLSQALGAIAEGELSLPGAHIVTTLPLSIAPAGAPRVLLIVCCPLDTLERARQVVTALAGAAGGALSLGLLAASPSQVGVRRQGSWLTDIPAEPEDDVPGESSEATAGVIRTMSHELRSPLATIKGYASTLLMHAQRLDAGEQRAFLEIIDRATDRLTVTIARILDYSEIESGSPPRLLVVDIGSLARDAVNARLLASDQSAPAGERFTLLLGGPERANVDAPDSQEARLLARADPRRLRQALDNLLDNAVQYSPHGGEISLAVTREPASDSTGARIHMTLRDHGMGIPAGELAAIFQDFHRVDNGLTRESAGIGLGLSIARRIVELHGGAIWAESVLGQGSAFHVTLPAYEDAPGHTSAAERQTGEDEERRACERGRVRY